jgi:succinate dehydrogenase hydrophobic anchor subunit
MMIVVVYDLTCKLYTHIVVRNPRLQSDDNWDNRRGWLWCEDHMCSLSVNALLWYFIKRSTLITSSFPWGPAANGLVGQKMSCKFLIASTHNYIWNTCLWLFSTMMLYHYLSAIAHVIDYYMNYFVHATPVQPSLCLQYLLYYCYCYRLYFTIAATILLLPLL